ncbi:MAG: DUF3786 domain-containing protein [Desulfobacterales bacterium]
MFYDGTENNHGYFQTAQPFQLPGLRGKTCLAFAAAVFKGKRRLADCPHLEPEIVKKYDGKTTHAQSVEEDMADAVEQLKARVKEIDLAAAAERVNGRYAKNKLTVRILGKDFSVDADGRMFSEIHVNHWLVIPFLNYILEGGGTPLSGKWVPFRNCRTARFEISVSAPV